jgi:hypothetical protein
VIVDPYNPPTSGPLRRYPSFSESGFDLVELASGSALAAFLSSPLTQAQADRFWNIRADTLSANTLHETTWDVVPPLSPSPIQDASVTAGDGTQPAWTARHAELEALAPGHVISIKSASADHSTLMNLPNLLQEIAGILGIP